MAFFEHNLLNILENKRAKKFENSAKCAYKPIFLYSIKKLNFAKNVTYDLLTFSRRIIVVIVVVVIMKQVTKSSK